MRFKQIIENTTAGSVATVAQPMMTQTRENANVKGLKPVQQVMKGKAAKKGPYANSIVESKVTEDDLAEQDLIVIPGQGRLRRTGFVKHDLDQGEHEGHTLKNSLHTIARAASDLDKRLSVQSEFPEWVSEKIGAAKGMMVTVMDYLISSQEMQHDSDAINEGEVSTSNLRTMYDLARMAKNYCNPEGQESLTELLKILKWYMDQAEQGVAEGILGSDPNRGQKVPHWAKRGIVGKIGRKLDPAWSDVQMTVPQHLLSKQSSVPATNSPATKDMPKATSITPTRAIPQKAGTNSSHPVPKNVVKTIADKPGVEEGDMFGDAEVSWEKGGRRAPTGAFRNPDFGKLMQKSVNKHNKAVVKTKQAIGSRIADIGAGGKEYNVKTDAAWDAAKKKVSEGSKVDRMVKHVEKSEEKAGKSKKDAENIAWATANKRGMLDNKNKKA